MRILFMGRKTVAADCLEFLCAQPGIEVVGVLTDDHLENSVTKKAARARGLRTYSFAEALSLIAAGTLQYDLGFSVLYWRKLQGAFLTVPRCQNINFHPAPLPEYKGTAGYNLAILDGLSSWGVTAHYIDAGIDTGGIIEVARFPIDPERETVAALERASGLALLDLFKRVAVAAIRAQGLLPVTPNVGGRYVTRQQMEEMKKIQTDDNVARKVRAFWYPPYDGAYVVIEGVKYTLASGDILRTLGDPAASNLFTPRA